MYCWRRRREELVPPPARCISAATHPPSRTSRALPSRVAAIIFYYLLHARASHVSLRAVACALSPSIDSGPLNLSSHQGETGGWWLLIAGCCELPVSMVHAELCPHVDDAAFPFPPPPQSPHCSPSPLSPLLPPTSLSSSTPPHHHSCSRRLHQVQSKYRPCLLMRVFLPSRRKGSGTKSPILDLNMALTTWIRRHICAKPATTNPARRSKR